jgi:DNA anti-recombination protein RmuC
VTSEAEAHLTAVLERMEHNIGVIADGHATLNEKFDTMAGDIVAIKDRLDRVETRLEGFAKKTDARLHRIEDHLGLNGASKSKRPTKRKR